MTDTYSMNKCFLIILLFYSTAAFSEGESIFHKLVHPLSFTDNTGIESELYQNTPVRFINTVTNLDKSFQEFYIVDDNDVALHAKPLKVSKAKAFKSVAVNLTSQIEIMDESGKKYTLKDPTKNYVIIYEKNTGWKYYKLALVDDQGNMVDVHGNPSTAVYKTSVTYFDQALLNTMAMQLSGEDSMDSDLFKQVKCMLEKNVPTTPTADKIVPVPPPEEKPSEAPASQGPSSDFWPKGEPSPLKQLFAKRNELKGRAKCISKQRDYEFELLQKSSWKGLSEEQRANKIYEMSKSKLKEIKAAAKTSGKDGYVNNFYLRRLNGHYIHPLVSAEVITCIMYQETEGTLNPLAYNYTYCHDTTKPSSDAIGLLQSRGDTFEDMLYHVDPKANLFPKISKESKKLIGKNISQARELLITSPELQFEAGFRIFNEKIKLVYGVNLTSGKKDRTKGEKLLMDAIANYDQDNTKHYLSQVKNCMKCLSNKRTGAQCYEELSQRAYELRKK